MEDKQVLGDNGNSPLLNLRTMLLCILLLVCVYIVWHSFFDNSPLASQPDISELKKAQNFKPFAGTQNELIVMLERIF